MIRALVVKELRQHWLAFLLILLSSAGALLIQVLLTTVQSASGSMLEAFHTLTTIYLVIVALAVCNRLVVAEYQGKTQLFLQSLPVSRFQMVAVKYLFGGVLLFGILAVSLGCSLALSARSDALTVRFAGILAARSFGFIWSVYSCFFMMGLLGRYRIALYIIGMMGAFALDTMTKLELRRFGPFELVNSEFAYERYEWPFQALGVTAGLTTAFIAGTVVLSLVREGTVASLLAEKMSHREKVFIVVVLMTFMFAITIFDESAQKEPYDIPNAISSTVGEVVVKVSLGASEDEARGRRLADLIAKEVSGLKDYLSIEELPPIFVVQGRELDGSHYERAKINNAEGLLVRANFLSSDFREADFFAWFTRELLVLASHERVLREPNRWVLDGFSEYWALRDRPQDRQVRSRRAAYGGRLGFDPSDSRDWLRYTERVGQDVASAVAWKGLTVLEQGGDEAALRAFVAAVLDCNTPGDIRALFYEWRRPLPALLREHIELTEGQFHGDWAAGLKKIAADHSDVLESISRVEGRLRFEPISESTRTVRYEVTGDPPSTIGRYAVLYAELPPFDDEVAKHEIRREENSFSRRAGELSESFSAGTRLYWTFATWSEQLECELISGWSREEIR